MSEDGWTVLWVCVGTVAYVVIGAAVSGLYARLICRESGKFPDSADEIKVVILLGIGWPTSLLSLVAIVVFMWASGGWKK